MAYNYLMFQHPESTEEIHVYTTSDMEEVFTKAEIKTFAKGETVFKDGGLWIDMGHAARRIIDETLMA